MSLMMVAVSVLASVAPFVPLEEPEVDTAEVLRLGNMVQHVDGIGNDPADMFVEAMESQRSAEECERYGGLDGMSDYYVGVTSGLVRALGWFTEWTVRNWDDLLFFIVSGSNDDTIREWGYGFLLDEDKAGQTGTFNYSNRIINVGNKFYHHKKMQELWDRTEDIVRHYL